MITALLLGSALAGSDPGVPPRTHHLGHRDHTDLVVRDGTELRTRWFVPRGEGPFPAVVTRTPYAMGPILDYECRMLVRRGFACVYQDVRGRVRSEGTWEPFVNEERDGQDLIAWIRAQEWSDGRVAWMGDSYLSATGWAVAATDGELTTLVSRIFAPALYPTAYEDGLLRHELVTAWMTLMPDHRNRLFAGSAYHKALQHRPRTTLDEVASGHEVGWYRQWLTGEDPTTPLWSQGDSARFDAAPATVTMPVLLVGGWSDAFIEADLVAWSQLATKSQSELVIGPWAHLGQAPSAVPLKGRFGKGGGRGQMLQFPRVVDWLQTKVQGASPRYEQTGVTTYVVGGDRWETRPDWPPATTARRFSASGWDRCSGALGDDALDQPLTYVYDPEHPLKSKGGAGILAGAVPFMNGVPPGFVRNNVRCERRTDVLEFRSAPLDRPLHFAGTIRVEMEVASDAPDTAFGFRLLEKRAHGPQFVLREGFTTLALRGGGPKLPYEPGARVSVVADTQPLEAEIHAGSELVLVITSSSFPAVEAHPNRAGTLSAAETTQIANQTVFAATLVLPEVAP